jgi:hypothetical protein
MAGQGLTAEQIAAAGQQAAANQQQAAPAQNQQQQAPAANQQQQQPGNQFILNQEQFDQRYGEKLTALEKELGLEPGAFKDPARLKERLSAQKKPTTPAPTGETLTGADLKLARMEALMTVGVPSKQIPLLLQHLNISGKTREEIAGSVQALIDLKLLSIDAPAQPGTQPPQGPPNAAQGAGNPGVPGTPGKKTFTLAEVREKSKDPVWYEANRAAIQEAMAKGEIK